MKWKKVGQRYNKPLSGTKLVSELIQTKSGGK
jgi:hypothetical protein